MFDCSVWNFYILFIYLSLVGYTGRRLTIFIFIISSVF